MGSAAVARQGVGVSIQRPAGRCLPGLAQDGAPAHQEPERQQPSRGGIVCRVWRDRIGAHDRRSL